MENNIPGYPITLTNRYLAALGSICAKKINLSRYQIARILSNTFWGSTASRCLEEFEMRGNSIEFWASYHVFFVANFKNIKKTIIVGYEPLPPRYYTSIRSKDKPTHISNIYNRDDPLSQQRQGKLLVMLWLDGVSLYLVISAYDGITDLQIIQITKFQP